MQTHVLFEQQNDIGYLTLACDEPGKPNTLDYQALDELEHGIKAIRSEESLRAVIVRSNSEKYFLVGANINALMTLNAQTIVPWVERGHAVFNQLAELPLPVIVLVEGFCLGGGLELALACDLVVASSNAKLGQPEANLGLVAGWGGCWRLPRRVGAARAKEMFFTAKILSAEEAYRIGLVDFVGDGEALQSHMESLVQSIRPLSRLALAQMKSLVDQSYDITPEESCQKEADASRLCMSSADTTGRIAGYLESRRKRQ
jgi:enoyl-CoA hydratase